MSSLTKSFFLGILAFSGIYFLFRTAPLAAQSFSLLSLTNLAPYFPRSPSNTMSAAGWHARAKPHPSPDSFSPSSDELAFAVLVNSQVDADGLELALFRPDTAVDASGSLLQLESKDFSRLAQLAKEAAALPDPGGFLNKWSVEAPMTEQPIERLFLPKEVSVQGWSRDRRRLSAPVAGHEELPDVLQELLGYVQESMEGYKRGEQDKEVIQRVKAAVPK